MQTYVKIRRTFTRLFRIDKETEYSRAGVFWYRNSLTKHVLNTWFNVFDVNIGNDIAESLNESFTLEELEISEMQS